MAGKKRQPTRTDHLTRALRSTQEAAAELKEIDLRTVSGDLRDEVKAARTAVEDSTKRLTRALRQDRPQLLEVV